MKPEQPSSNLHAIYPAVFPAQAGEPLETDVEFKPRKAEKDKLLSFSTTTNNTVINILPVIDEWNSLTPLNQTSESGSNFESKLTAALKFSSELEPSLAAMVVEFMVMTLHIMGDLQKAYMEQAINTLKLVQMDMTRQIVELEQEKEANFRKDLTSGIIEATSAAIGIVGSSITAGRLGSQLSKQSKLSSTSGGQALEGQLKKASAQAETNIEQVKKLAGIENTPVDVQKDVAKVVKSAEDIKPKVNAVTDEAKNSEFKFDTDAEIQNKNGKIKSKIDLINAQQHIWNGASALVKSAAQIVQAPLSAEAVGHGISAKEWENSKEIRNSLYRQMMEWVSSTRDSIGRMISTMQEIQKQDALNALASSQKLV